MWTRLALIAILFGLAVYVVAKDIRQTFVQAKPPDAPVLNAKCIKIVPNPENTKEYWWGCKHPHDERGFCMVHPKGAIACERYKGPLI